MGTLQRLEQGGAHGTLETYLRLSDLWGIPVDALLANDFTLIPADFFQRHPVPKEKTIATDEPSIIGFRGEQLILAQERARVAQGMDVFFQHSRFVVQRRIDYAVCVFLKRENPSGLSGPSAPSGIFEGSIPSGLPMEAPIPPLPGPPIASVSAPTN